MPAEPEPVSPREVSEFLAEVARLSRCGLSADPAERLAFFERKADLLTRIADRDGGGEAHAVARGAREQLAQIRAGHAGPSAPHRQDRPGGGACDGAAEPGRGRATRPGRQPRSVRAPGVAVAGVPDAGRGDLGRAARAAAGPGRVVRGPPSVPGPGGRGRGDGVAERRLARRDRAGRRHRHHTGGLAVAVPGIVPAVRGGSGT